MSQGELYIKRTALCLAVRFLLSYRPNFQKNIIVKTKNL